MINLEIQPVHDNSRDCLEDMLVSIAEWYGCGYELMFSESLEFRYIWKDAEIVTLGNTLTPEKNFFKCLEAYHGLKTILRRPKDNQQLLQLVIDELTQKHPNIIQFDSFWSPWELDYKKIHSTHICSITGYDPQVQVLYCTDPYRMKYMEILPLENFLEGTEKEIYFFVFAPGFKQEINWRQILQTAVKRMNDLDTGRNAFDILRHFAALLDKYLDFELEFPTLERLWRSPLYVNINNIARGRNQFAKSLWYLSEQLGITDLGILSQKYSQLAQEWNSLVSLLVKGAYSRKSDTIKYQISERLRQLAGKEEILTEKMAGLIENADHLPDDKFECFDNSGPGTDMECPAVKSIEYLDLSQSMNNQGFGDYDDPSCAADFTGLGECLLVEGICSQQEIIIDNMRFRFPRLGIDVNDNVSCQGQFITVPGIKCELLMFLGCAEWGNFSGKATIYYENNYQEDILLQFSDWFSSRPLYGEKIAWAGWATKKVSKNVKERRQLYAQYCKAINDRPMIGIRLPECANIHIFSISVGC